MVEKTSLFEGRSCAGPRARSFALDIVLSLRTGGARVSLRAHLDARALFVSILAERGARCAERG
jgi:hypothetical protein